MPLYDYLCDTCGSRFESVYSIHEDSTTTPCPHCNLGSETPPRVDMQNQKPPPRLDVSLRDRVILARKIITRFPGVTHGMVTEAHFNTSVGKVIHSDTEFRSELSRQSDELSERNQFPVSFAPIDHRDAKEHLGVTDEGMESTYSERVRSGKQEVVKHL